MKIDFVCFNPDNTTTEKRCKLLPGGKVKFSKDWQPTLKPGRSVFPQAKQEKRLKLFKKRRKRRAFAVYGAPECFELDVSAGKLDDHWTIAEGKKFVSKLVALSAVKQKPFSNFQVYLLFGGLCFVAITLLLLVRKIGL